MSGSPTPSPTIDDFLSQLAARTPTPGGGAASALAGAIGAAQGAMSAAYTTGGEAYKAVEAQAMDHMVQLRTLASELVALMQKDADAYALWVETRNLPKETSREKQLRKEKLATAREAATKVPETILETARNALERLADLVKICNPNLIADVNVAAQLLNACARGATTQALGNLDASAGKTPSLERIRRAKAHRKRCADLARTIEKSTFEIMGIRDDTE